MRLAARLVVIAAIIYFGAHVAIAVPNITASALVTLAVVALAFLVDSVLARAR